MKTILLLEQDLLGSEKNIGLAPALLSSGHFYGLGAFTSFRSRGGQFLGWSKHMHRLNQAAQAVYGESLEGQLEQACYSGVKQLAKHSQADLIFRVLLTKADFGAAEFVLLIQARKFPKLIAPKQLLVDTGMELVSTSKSCLLKHNFYFYRMQRKRVLTSNEEQDVLFCSPQAKVFEATTSNIVFLGKKGLISPTLGPNIYFGTTLELFQEFCDSTRLSLEFRDVHLGQLGEFEGACLLNSSALLAPIESIAEQSLNTAESAFFKQIFESFHQYVNQSLKPI